MGMSTDKKGGWEDLESPAVEAVVTETVVAEVEETPVAQVAE